MADNLDEVFGTDEAVETVEPVVDTQPEPEVVEAPVEPEPEPEPEPPVVEARTEDRIPIGALLDEREKRKTLEAEIERLKQQAPQAQANIPDPYDDPNGFAAHIESQITQARQTQKVDTSYHLAVRDYGKDKVEEATAASAADSSSSSGSNSTHTYVTFLLVVADLGYCTQFASVHK